MNGLRMGAPSRMMQPGPPKLTRSPPSRGTVRRGSQPPLVDPGAVGCAMVGDRDATALQADRGVLAADEERQLRVVQDERVRRGAPHGQLAARGAEVVDGNERLGLVARYVACMDEVAEAAAKHGCNWVPATPEMVQDRSVSTKAP